MNTETGRIYTTPAEVAAARARGEPLAQVSPRVAQYVRAGQQALTRRERNDRKRAERLNRRRERKGTE